MATRELTTEGITTATKQRAFDRVAVALRKQGRPAYKQRSQKCLYEDADGARCALGHLLTAKEIGILRRGKRLDATINELSTRLVQGVVNRHKVDEQFLSALQSTHDKPALEYMNGTDPKQWLRLWKAQMRVVAQMHGLKTTKLGKAA